MYNCNVLSFFSLKTKNLKTAWYETRCPTTVRKWYYQSTHLCVFGDPAWLWKAEEHSSNCIWAVKLAAEAGNWCCFSKQKTRTIWSKFATRTWYRSVSPIPALLALLLFSWRCVKSCLSTSITYEKPRGEAFIVKMHPGIPTFILLPYW